MEWNTKSCNTTGVWRRVYPYTALRGYGEWERSTLSFISCDTEVQTPFVVKRVIVSSDGEMIRSGPHLNTWLNILTTNILLFERRTRYLQLVAFTRGTMLRRATDFCRFRAGPIGDVFRPVPNENDRHLPISNAVSCSPVHSDQCQ